MPGQTLNNGAAHKGANRDRRATDCTPDSKCPVPLVRWNSVAEQSERERNDERATSSLHCSSCDQRVDIRGKRCSGRRSGKKEHAREEEPPPAETVTERRAGQQENGKGQGKSVDRPFEASKTGVEPDSKWTRQCHRQ